MEINFRPTVKQKYIFDLFNDDHTTEIVWGGSVGGGKTYAIAALMIMKCLQHPTIRFGLARNNLTVLKQNTLTSVFEVLTDWGLQPDEHYTYNQTTGRMKFFNGSEIVLVELQYLPSDPTYARLGGLLLTSAVIDEAHEVDVKGKEILITRVGRWKNEELGVKPITVMTCNPSKASFLYRDYYVPYTEGTLKPYQAFVPVLTSDNTYLPEAYIENLEKTLSLHERERLLLGRWDGNDDPNVLIKDEILQLAYDLSIELSTDNKMAMSIDVAFKADKCVFFIWKGLTVIDIVTYNKDTDETLVAKIKELAAKHSIPTNMIAFDADGVGLYLKQHFPSAREVHNGGKTIKTHSYSNLKTELYFKLADLMEKGMVKIATDKYRKELEEEIAVVKHKPRESMEKTIELISKAEMKRSLGRSPDYADCFAYGVLFQISNGTMKASDFTFISFM
jgi:phage terminase large subunit